MNKKFTYLVAALLATGGFASSALAADLNPAASAITSLDDLVSGKYFYLVQNAGASALDNGDVALGMSKNDATKTLTALNLSYASNKFTLNRGEEAENYLWTVETTVENGIKYYAFKNVKTGNYLAFDGTGAFITNADNATASKSIIYFSDDDAADGNAAKTAFANGLQLKIKGGSTYVDYIISSSLVASYGSAQSFWLYPVEETVISGQTALNNALNSYMGGSGFSLAPADDKTVVDEENNVFSQKVRAVAIPRIVDNVSKEEVPAGTYLVVSYPDELIDGIDGTAFSRLTNEQKMEIFNECEFIAVSSSESYATSTVDKEGLKLVTVSGASLNKYTETDKQSANEDIYVGNACFTITQPDNHVTPAQFELAVNNARIINSSKTDGSHTGVSVNIGVTKISGTNYVTTTAEPSLFKAAPSSTQLEVIELVKAEKAPSVYTIQFVSGEDDEDSEYNKYLGVASLTTPSSYTFVAQGEALVDLSLPQYQFVVSNVDTDGQTVEFTNIETKEKFSTQLYKTDAEDTYTVIGSSARVRIAEDDAKGANQYAAATSTSGMVVKLTEVTDLDAYAGFGKFEINNNVPYELAFAKNDASSEKLYIAIDPEDDNEVKTVLSESSSLQVVFEPIVKTTDEDVVDEEEIAVTYAYKNDKDVVYKASEDLVKYYTYKLKVVDSDGDNYIKLNSSLRFEIGDKDDANTFIVKYRYNGSIALVNSSLSETSRMLSANVRSERAEYDDEYAYAVPEEDQLSLFLEAEEMGVSLAAEPVHVSLEAENGGFLTVNDKNEGAIAIRTEAGEDLTFWVDTTASEEYIPAFYIAKGGKYMYNSADSLNVGTTEAKALYGIGQKGKQSKAIFKTATLVNSDTLKTIVDDKETVVAEKADQNKGILGGVKNFQYNIVKASTAEDNYVIRSVGNPTQYLTNFNGVLGFISDKDNAMRVIVERQAAPTANESISATDVKVVALDGAVNVKNAAGKNVVVSTILGQIVANEVLTSDNATISVPAGIAIVSVDGEEAVKVSVK